jgi:uncharacterized protein GlcG (DUF336 family)
MARWICTAIIAAALAAPRTLPAQLLDTKVISLEAAKKIVAGGEAEARRNRWSVSVLTAGRAFPGLTPVEMGVSIVVAGRAIGGVGVSGATSAQDVQMAQAGASTLTP